MGSAALSQDQCGPMKTSVEFVIDPDSTPNAQDVAAMEKAAEDDEAEEEKKAAKKEKDGSGSDDEPEKEDPPPKQKDGISTDDMHSSKAYMAGQKINDMFKTHDPALGKMCVNETMGIHETLEESLPPCFSKGYDPFGRKVYFNKCEQTSSLQRPPSDLGPDVPSSEEVVSGCTERKDCFSCVVQSSAITFCGWCEDQYPGKCMESMFGKGKPVDGECKAWSDEICFKSSCPDQMDCPSCVGEPSCGWCHSNNRCFERITQPWGDEPRNGTCEKFKFKKGTCEIELPQGCQCKGKHSPKYANVGSDLPECGGNVTKGARPRTPIQGKHSRATPRANRTHVANQTVNATEAHKK